MGCPVLTYRPFIRDISSSSGDENGMYAYVTNNPIGFVDPMGTMARGLLTRGLSAGAGYIGGLFSQPEPSVVGPAYGPGNDSGIAEYFGEQERIRQQNKNQPRNFPLQKREIDTPLARQRRDGSLLLESRPRDIDLPETDKRSKEWDDSSFNVGNLPRLENQDLHGHSNLTVREILGDTRIGKYLEVNPKLSREINHIYSEAIALQRKRDLLPVNKSTRRPREKITQELVKFRNRLASIVELARNEIRTDAEIIVESGARINSGSELALKGSQNLEKLGLRNSKEFLGKVKTFSRFNAIGSVAFDGVKLYSNQTSEGISDFSTSIGLVAIGVIYAPVAVPLGVIEFSIGGSISKFTSRRVIAPFIHQTKGYNTFDLRRHFPEIRK